MNPADRYATDVEVDADGIVVRVGGQRRPDRRCSARFNVVERALRGDRRRARRASTTVDARPRRSRGRRSSPAGWSAIDAGQTFLVVVDYAHTPDSIQHVLRGARPLAAGRVDRRVRLRWRPRPGEATPMGEAATAEADLTVITTDNPRVRGPRRDHRGRSSRAPARAAASYVVEPDRRRRDPHRASDAPAPGDVVVIAGKGHETVQEVGGDVLAVRRPRGRARGAGGARGRRVKPRRLADVARAVDGLLVGDDVDVSVGRDRLAGGRDRARCSSRSRGAGGRARFVDEAFDRGAAGVLVRDGTPSPGPAVHVRGRRRRRSCGSPPTSAGGSTARVVAITGANGKTSTKDMTAAVCGDLVPHAREPGVVQQRDRRAGDAPRRPRRHGGRSSPSSAPATPGDVAAALRRGAPGRRVVTNVGVAHMEVFGSWEAIVEASAEPVDALDDDGVAVLNADDPVVAGVRGALPRPRS